MIAKKDIKKSKPKWIIWLVTAVTLLAVVAVIFGLIGGYRALGGSALGVKSFAAVTSADYEQASGAMSELTDAYNKSYQEMLKVLEAGDKSYSYNFEPVDAFREKIDDSYRKLGRQHAIRSDLELRRLFIDFEDKKQLEQKDYQTQKEFYEKIMPIKHPLVAADSNAYELLDATSVAHKQLKGLKPLRDDKSEKYRLKYVELLEKNIELMKDFIDKTLDDNNPPIEPVHESSDAANKTLVSWHKYISELEGPAEYQAAVKKLSERLYAKEDGYR